MSARAAEKGLSRSFKIAREKIDADKRTLEVAFSSETPVERWGENEILSHDKGDYNFDRLNDSHPLLLGHAEHDPDSQIGVIESARVDGDKIGRAIVRFGNSAKASEIFQDVIDGIRTLISVGYDRIGIVKSDKAKDGRVTTRYKWEPTHIAIVPVPADTKVGVGREKDGERGMKKRRCADCDGSGHCHCRDEDGDGDADCADCGGSGKCAECKGNGYIQTAKSKETVDSIKNLNAEEIAGQLTTEQKTKMRILFDKETPGGNGTLTVEESEKKVSEARTKAEVDFKARAKEITAVANELAKDHGSKNNGQMRDQIRVMANEALESGQSIADFKVRCLLEVTKAKPARQIGIADVTDNPSDYSLFRAIQSCIRRGGKCLPDGREGEVHTELVRQANSNSEVAGLGFSPQGFMIPHDVRAPFSPEFVRSRGTRDYQATLFGSGGAFVPSQLMPPVIELLRNRIVLDKCGVRQLSGLQGNVFIPRQEAASTAYSVPEIGALTASQAVLGQIALTPKRVGATGYYSKQFLFQSTPDAEAFVYDDYAKVIALKWDYLGLNGQGANDEPLGILNTPGIGTITFGATPTYIKIVRMETDIRTQNVMGPLVYVSTPGTKGSLKTVAEALTGATTIGGSQNAIWKPGRDPEEGMVNGYRALDSNQIPNNLVIAGDFSEFIRALWGGFDVVVEPYTKAPNAEWAITMNTWGDYAMRHPQAFEASTDAGNQ